MADITVNTNLELFPEGREPADMRELTEWINEHIAMGRRAAVTIAILIAHAKDAYYVDAASEWLAWAKDEFGYERRMCFLCAKAGRLLLQCNIVALAKCDLPKLEMIATLHEAKPDQCRALLEVWNPADHSRDEVKAKVASYLDEIKTVTCKSCGDEFEATKRKQTLCETCENRARQQRTERKARGADRILGDIAAIDDEAALVLAKEIAPGVAMRAGLRALQLALIAVEQYKCWSPEDFDTWEGDLNDAVESFRYLKSQVQ